jgi:cell division protein FtsB
MAAGENPLRRIRLVYRRSSNTLKIVVIAALVLGTLSLLMLRGAILRMEQKAEELRQQAAVLEQENKKLEESISQLGTVQSVTDLAEQLLGLVDPDTVIFSPEG